MELREVFIGGKNSMEFKKHTLELTYLLSNLTLIIGIGLSTEHVKNFLNVIVIVVDFFYHFTL